MFLMCDVESSDEDIQNRFLLLNSVIEMTLICLICKPEMMISNKNR